MDIKDQLYQQLKEPTEAAVKILVEDFGQDSDFIKEVFSDALKDIGKAILAGASIEEAVGELDTKTTFELAGAFADIGKHQIKMLRAAEGILEQVKNLVLKKIAAALL